MRFGLLLYSKRFSKKLKLRISDFEKMIADKGIARQPPPIESFVDRLKLEDLLKRRFFYVQSFEIYGGAGGLYDYGPVGCAIKQNMIQAWRRHFIIEEGMLEVECSALTPKDVLKASGHVERFTDWMVMDTVNGRPDRADHLIKREAEKLMKDKKTPDDSRSQLEQILTQLDGLSNHEMDTIIKNYGMKSQDGNDLTAPVEFNLMFPTSIGPTGDVAAYLRPETAQGIFVNFKRLLEFNQGKLPFAAAQIGSGFRNEISPRQGLLRVREFTMCEIEHFVDPTNKNHPKFNQVSHLELTLYSACDQNSGKEPSKMRIGDAVLNKIVNNETLGYYMARTHLYLVSVGIDSAKLRFRQHLSTEMAHYAEDCWDAECLTTHGWVECVGNADRACYDLTQHSKATRTKLAAERLLPHPKQVEVAEIVPNRQALGKNFKSESKKILAVLDDLTNEEIQQVEESLKATSSCTVKVDGIDIQLTSEFVHVKRMEKTVHIEDVIPSVIEPSFGIGRIMYAVLEHSFRQRPEDEKRMYLDLVPFIAPIKCSILPISANERLEPIIAAVQNNLTKLGITSKIDDSSGSIGRRYARTDEIGIPFGVTIDFESETQPWTVTLRHAPTMKQVRLEVSQLAEVVQQLVSGTTHWNEVMLNYPVFVAGEGNEKN